MSNSFSLNLSGVCTIAVFDSHIRCHSPETVNQKTLPPSKKLLIIIGSHLADLCSNVNQKWLPLEHFLLLRFPRKGLLSHNACHVYVQVSRYSIPIFFREHWGG